MWDVTNRWLTMCGASSKLSLGDTKKAEFEGLLYYVAVKYTNFAVYWVARDTSKCLQ